MFNWGFGKGLSDGTRILSLGFSKAFLARLFMWLELCSVPKNKVKNFFFTDTRPTR